MQILYSPEVGTQINNFYAQVQIVQTKFLNSKTQVQIVQDKNKSERGKRKLHNKK